MPDKFQALHLYKLAFRQPLKFPNFAPKTIKVLGGVYLVWGISSDDEYNVFLYVLNESDPSGTSIQKKNIAVPVAVIVVGILAVLGLGLSIVLFKDVKEVFGVGGLGITFAAIIGFGGFFVFKKFL